jgi:hypothetical protein
LTPGAWKSMSLPLFGFFKLFLNNFFFEFLKILY